MLLPANVTWHLAQATAIDVADVTDLIAPSFDTPALVLVEALDDPLSVICDGDAYSDPATFVLPARAMGAGWYALPYNPSLLHFSGTGQMRYAYIEGALGAYAELGMVERDFTTSAASSVSLQIPAFSDATGATVTLMQVDGTGSIKITLDGRPATSTDYDLKLEPQDNLAPASARLLSVLPSSIRVFGDGTCTYRAVFEHYPSGSLINVNPLGNRWVF